MQSKFIAVAVAQDGNIVPVVINVASIALIEHCQVTGGAFISFNSNIKSITTVEPSEKLIATIDLMAECKVVDETELPE